MARKTTSLELENMQVGEVKDFPREKINSVQALCSMDGFRLDRTYATHMDKERGVVQVTRIS